MSAPRALITLAAASLLLSFVACGSDSSGDGGGGAGKAANPPRVLELTANPPTLSEGETTTITATVTDDDGLEENRSVTFSGSHSGSRPVQVADGALRG